MYIRKANKYSSGGGGNFSKKIGHLFSNNRVMVSVGIVMLVLFTSIGYSALATSFLVSGEAHLRVKADIRITDIKRIESSNSGYETYNPEYSKEGTKIFTTLPNLDSTLTYQVEITNTSSDIYALKEINEILNSNPNIEYVIENIKVKDRIEAGSTVKFNITVKYKEGITEVPEDNTSVIELNYKFIIPDSTPPEVMFSLQEGSYTGNRIVTITATDIGGSGYDFMNIEVHNSEGKVESKSNSRVTDDTYSVTLDSASIWTIYVQAYDKAGNKQLTEPLNENGFTYRAYKIKEDKTLYGVLQKEAAGNRYAREYTGEHQDSIEGLGNKKIYHYYAANNTDGTAVLDKNNVIFAGFCWQMIRTTDTGGVKLIYNGEAEDGKCLSTRGNHTGVKGSSTAKNLNGDYIYGTSYTYDESTKAFTLTGEKTTKRWNNDTYKDLIGLYTCGTTSDTCTTLSRVSGYNNATIANVASYTVDTATHYSQIGTSPFTVPSGSLPYVGYMYNTVYPVQQKEISRNDILPNSSFSTNYWYADSVEWDSSTKKYKLVNPYKVSSTAEYPNLAGKYTLRGTSETYTSSYAYYIAAANNTIMYYIQLRSGNKLDYYNDSYTYGDSYTENSDGTYTLNNPTTIKRTEYYDNRNNMRNKYVCKNAVNNKCSELWYTVVMYNNYFYYIKSTDEYKFANGFTYENGVYKLNDENNATIWAYEDSRERSKINNAHYTCFNTTGECKSIAYVYHIYSSFNGLYYMNLTNGKSIEDAINEMLYGADVNRTNSTIKTLIDLWYERYMIDYTEYLEDTIFCNNRSQSNSSTNGLNPNGGSVTTYLQFKEYNITKDLTCENETDRFSVNNPKAKLKYPVGLMSYPEMYLLNNDNIRKTGQKYWLGSPSYFYQHVAVERFVSGVGSMTGGTTVNVGDSNGNSYGMRPAVSLKPGTIYSSGDGSMANPYVVGSADTTSPTLSFSLDEGVYEDNQTVTITTTDDNFDHMDVQVLYEGEVVKELKSVFTNTVEIELDRKGVWTISVIAYDEAGNTQEGGSFLSGRTYKNYIIGKDDTLYGVTRGKGVLDNTSSEFVTSPTGIDFSKAASDTNGKGLYIRSGTENERYPIYYYRGEVYDNNVIFGGYCWKIVRTTDTGGTKLIYNGVATDGKCNNIGSASLIGTSKFNANANSPADFGYMYGVRYEHNYKKDSEITNGMIFGNDIEYNDGVYILKDIYTVTNGWNSNDKSTVSSKYHYTCFTTSNTCSEVYYIYSTHVIRYMTLNGGKNIDDILNEMTSGSTNENDSEIKKYIDDWYLNNMIEYTDYIEDTIWCNDRSIYKKNGWDKDFDNSDRETAYLTFGPYGRSPLAGKETTSSVVGFNTPILSCPNKNDSFTVGSSGNGKLKYPIGLLTGDELNFAGGGDSPTITSNYLDIKDGSYWWLLSPGFFHEIMATQVLMAKSGMARALNLYVPAYMNDSNGVRPMISLKNGNTISGGDGTADNPYVVVTK